MNVRNMPRADEYLVGTDANYLTRVFCNLRNNFPGRKQFSVLALDRVGESESNVIEQDSIVDLPDGGFHTDALYVCTFINKRDQYPWHAEERSLDWLMHKLKDGKLWQVEEKKTPSRNDQRLFPCNAEINGNNSCPTLYASWSKSGPSFHNVPRPHFSRSPSQYGPVPCIGNRKGFPSAALPHLDFPASVVDPWVSVDSIPRAFEHSRYEPTPNRYGPCFANPEQSHTPDNQTSSEPGREKFHTIHIFTYYSPCWKCSDAIRELAEFLENSGLNKTVRVNVGFVEPYVPMGDTGDTQESSDSCLEKLTELEREFGDFVTFGYLPPSKDDVAKKRSPLHYRSRKLEQNKERSTRRVEPTQKFAPRIYHPGPSWRDHNTNIEICEDHGNQFLDVFRAENYENFENDFPDEKKYLENRFHDDNFKGFESHFQFLGVNYKCFENRLPNDENHGIYTSHFSDGKSEDSENHPFHENYAHLKNNFSHENYESFENHFPDQERQFPPRFGKSRTSHRFLTRETRRLPPYSRGPPTAIPPSRRDHSFIRNDQAPAQHFRLF